MSKINNQSIFLRSLFSIGSCMVFLGLTIAPSRTEANSIASPPKPLERPTLNQALPAYLATLRGATRLEGRALGMVAAPSKIYQAFEQALQPGKTSRSDIKQLLDEATPSGRIYTAMLLVKLDPKAGRQLLEQMRSDQTALTEASGCGTSQTSVGAAVEDILQGRSGVFLPLPYWTGGATDFIPQGWQIEKEVSGDLNRDGQADRVVQIAEVGDSWTKRRSLVILKATSTGWEQMATAPKLLLCSRCAGMMGGLKGQHIRVDIKDGVLIVQQLTGSRHAIAMTHRFWIDRTSQKMVLIGQDLTPYDRINGNQISDSYNFLTGKRIVEEYQGQGNGQKKLIRTQTLKIARELSAIESVDIEAARSSAPELPSN